VKLGMVMVGVVCIRTFHFEKMASMLCVPIVVYE